MSKFNLEKAMAGAPVVTRDGQKAVIVKDFDTTEAYGDFVIVVNIDGKAQAFEIWNDGRYYTTKGEESVYDLFMAPVKREGWVKFAGSIFNTEQDAMANDAGQINVVKIEWEE